MPFDGFPNGLDLPFGGLLPTADGASGLHWHGLPDASGTTWLRLTPDLPARLPREAAHDRRPVVLGADADPYLPVERTLALTRQVLEALEHAGRPVTIVTRTAAVLRDRDILFRLARRGLVRVCIALATLDILLARRLEPRAASPTLRLATLRALAAAGIPAAVLVDPVIAGLNDLEPERILAAAAAAGATEAGFVPLPLPPGTRLTIEAWVQAQLPHHAAQALALVREARALSCIATSQPAATLAGRFQAAASRLGLNRPAAHPADHPLPEARRHHPEPALAAA